ncbi:MAG: FecR domain-containing protein [Proteobacteria bacterium]|nr:FecR domain-containing protein [Pseudomonadota bacterium]
MNGDGRTDAAPRAGQAIEAQAADWLARRDGDGWADADERGLMQWLDSNIAHRVAFLRLQAAWEETGRLQALGAGWQGSGPPPRGFWREPLAHRHERLSQMLARRPQRQRVRPRRGVGRVAAAAAAVVCALGLGWGWHLRSHVDTASYATAVGEVRTLALPDGSHVTLASDSRIQVRLSPQHRDIALERGEAIFQVAKDPQRPFAVAAEGYAAVAVGTRYSVRRDPGDLRVAVTEGTVRLEPAGHAGSALPTALLPAGSVAEVDAQGVVVRRLAQAEVERMLDWREGMLSFHATPLAQAVGEFNRFNARQMVLADPAIGALQVSGRFRWDNEDGFARLLQAGFPIRAEYDGQRIVLHAR